MSVRDCKPDCESAYWACLRGPWPLDCPALRHLCATGQSYPPQLVIDHCEFECLQRGEINANPICRPPM